MKARMILNDGCGWRLELAPETDVEATMLEAAAKGYGVSVDSFSTPTLLLVVQGKGRPVEKGEAHFPEE